MHRTDRWLARHQRVNTLLGMIGIVLMLCGIAVFSGALATSGYDQNVFPPAAFQPLVTASEHLNVPRPCKVGTEQHPGWIPSGDAARQYVPQVHAVQEFVCTDGKLVFVKQYGN